MVNKIICDTGLPNEEAWVWVLMFHWLFHIYQTAWNWFYCLKSSCSSSIEKNGECASKAKTNLHHNVCVFKGFLNLLESVKLCFSCTVDVCVCSVKNVVNSMMRWLSIIMVLQKMVNGGKIDFWTCVNFSTRVQRDLPFEFCWQLMDMCNSKGMVGLHPSLFFCHFYSHGFCCYFGRLTLGWFVQNARNSTQIPLFRYIQLIPGILRRLFMMFIRNVLQNLQIRRGNSFNCWSLFYLISVDPMVGYRIWFEIHNLSCLSCKQALFCL
jgi:hypothetical protein